MPYRSWLFVPGDSEKKLDKVNSVPTDVVIVDLEDAVAPDNKSAARALTLDWLTFHLDHEGATQFQRWVRINALDTPWWREDIKAVLPGRPAGVVLPKCTGPEQLKQVSAELYEIEQKHGLAANSVKILPLVSETPVAALTIGSYIGDTSPRLIGLTWGAEDLSAAIGAGRKRDEDGMWTDAFRMVRAQTLLTAHARQVMAIDTLHSDFRDDEGLALMATASRADGFSGMLAIHPGQVGIINTAFTPSSAALDRARNIVRVFEDNPGIGALQLDGEMIDQPHLTQAKKLLAEAPTQSAP